MHATGWQIFHIKQTLFIILFIMFTFLLELFSWKRHKYVSIWAEEQ